MAAYISFQPTDFFNPLLYTGTGAASQAQTGVGFQPDFTWIKGRDAAESNALFDSVRGVEQVLYSNTTAAEASMATGLTAFGADGFTVGNDGKTGSSGYPPNGYVSWNWKAGTTSGLSGGTITPSSYSINTTSGFGIYQYTGNGTSGATISHGLGAVPGCMIIKKTNTTEHWAVYNKGMDATAPEDYYLQLNGTASRYDNVAIWNDTAPTSTLFSLGNDGTVNTSAATYIAYVWAEKKGYSKFGSYTGNGNADGPFVYTGFRPAFLIVRRTDSGGDWFCWDDKRGTYNVNTPCLAPNASTAETSKAIPDFLSNGFKLRDTNVDANASSGTYIYMAFAEFPFVSSNSKAGVAR